MPGRRPQRSTPLRRASSRSPEGDRREVLHHGGRRAGAQKWTAAKRSTREGVKPVPGTGLPRSSSPRRASSQFVDGDRRDSLHHGGRRSSPQKGNAAKSFTTGSVERVPERTPSRSAPPRRVTSSRSSEGDCRERFTTESVEPVPGRDRCEVCHHGGRRVGPRKGTAAQRSTGGSVEPVPGREPSRVTSPRSASRRFKDGDPRESFRHRGRRAGPRKGNAAKRSHGRASSQLPEGDRREALHHGGRPPVPGREQLRNALQRWASRRSPEWDRSAPPRRASSRTRNGTAAKSSTTEGVGLVPRRKPSRIASPRTASSRSIERDRCEALQHGGRRSGPNMGIAEKRCTTEGVEPFPARGQLRSSPLRRASRRSPEGNRSEALHHGGRPAGPLQGDRREALHHEGCGASHLDGTAEKLFTSGASSRCPERDRYEALHHGGRRTGSGSGLPRSAPLRKPSKQSAEGDRHEAFQHGRRRAGPLNGTAAKLSNTEGFEPWPGRAPLGSAPLRKASTRPESLHHGGRRTGPRNGSGTKRSTTEGVKLCPEGDRREVLQHEGS